MSDQAAAPVSPELPAAKFRFLTEQLNQVPGFLIPSSALYLAGIEYAQRGLVAGGVCEIGVYRGKSFAAMTSGLPAADAAVAIDIFDAQHLNMDSAHAVNVLTDFRSSLELIGMTGRVEIISESSLDLEDKGFLAAGRRFRLFSVDGGHLAVHVRSDLKIAEATLVPGGVVAADDVLHPHYLGVITGIFEYLNTGGTLVPYALIPNKLLLTDPDGVERNRELMRERFGAGLAKVDVPFHASTIDVYQDVAWDVRSTTGLRAPLVRPVNAAAAEATSLRAQVDLLTRREQALERALRRHETAAARRAALVPQRLRPAARAVYRRLLRARRGR